MCLQDFLLSFAAIALHFVRLDSQMFKAVAVDEGLEPESISSRYLNPLCWMLQLRGIPFYQALQNSQEINILPFVAALNEKIVEDPLDLVQTLAEFTTLSLRLIIKWPKFVFSLISACMIVGHLIDFALERVELDINQTTIVSPEMREMLEEAYAFFRTIDVAYQTYIAKKSSSMTTDSNEVLFKLIGNAYDACAKLMPDFAMDIARALEIDVPEDTEMELLPALIRTRWRLQVLRKQIVEGRMELRVNGIETMQNDLVSLYRQYIVDVVDGADNPIIRSSVQFIKDSKLLDYIVGIDSHEQLISRGPNIVGFLIVSGAYTDEDTDTLWRTVTDGQDNRVVPDVLKMLTQTFTYHPASSHALVYLCQKLLELPLHRFDQTMTEYCDALLSNIKEKAMQRRSQNDETTSQTDIIPFQLCVRLIRETPTVPELSSDQKNYLLGFATKQISSLLEMGLHDDLKIEMYKQCINDISACNETALGSIRAMCALLQPSNGSDLPRLIEEFDLTRLVVNNLGEFCDSVSSESPPSQCLSNVYARIHLLSFIIEKSPQSFSDELCNFFWQKVVDSPTLGDRYKNMVWDVLSRVAVTAIQTEVRNSFVERMFRDYLPTVKPERYTISVLGLTTKAVLYGMTFDSAGTPDPGDEISFPGMDQLWRIITTALPQTIEQQAIDRAIELYLDHPLVHDSDIKSVQATHIALVDRCIDELMAAASKLRLPSPNAMDVDVDDDEQIETAVAANELRYSRHLTFLRQFIKGLKSRPLYHPGRRQSPELPPDGAECGQILDVSYQYFNGSNRSPVQTLRMSENCTTQQLIDKLKKTTGFTLFNVIMGGRKMDWSSSPEQTLHDAKVGQLGLLMITKHPDAAVLPVETPPDPVIDAVLEHFDTLYELLTAEEKVAREMFEFLAVFGPHAHIRSIVRDLDASKTELLPLNHPYKAMYTINAFRVCFEEDRSKESLDAEFTAHWVRTLMSFFAHHEIFPLAEGDFIRPGIARHCIDIIHKALNYYIPIESGDGVETTHSEAKLFVDKVFDTFKNARSCVPQGPVIAEHLALVKINTFSVLFKASEKGLLNWEDVCKGDRLKDAMTYLLLEDTRHDVRKGVASAITGASDRALNIDGSSSANDEVIDLDGIATPASAPESTKILDQIVISMWDIVADMLANSLESPKPSEEFFDMAYDLFRSYVAKFPDQVDLSALLHQWGDLLIKYTPHEFIGRDVPDHLVLGLIRLIRTCLEATDSKAILEHVEPLLRSLFHTYLFPELSDSTAEVIHEPTVPIMHEITREEIYKVFLFLSNNPDNFELITKELLEDIIPYDTTFVTNAYADRTKLIRAPEGYAGQTNLSNICYLNSLMTQLFMNVGFRKFMLDAPLADDEDVDQELLIETKRLFSYLQNTWQRSVNPSDFIRTIQTYDNEQIDVNVQMDVDEFYNLLFDRWENQIKSKELNKKFKSFYGGQLVQQIKSKECEHVSERLEPFSAIQCDIKGKANLEESLSAYVEGEVMQGDNKYLCSSCERHVDAVKRACLKEVPDNLIFHLKRFDFDMLMMLRNKINDEFRFSSCIDMAPYQATYLNNPDEPVEPDMFELVGVLVHSGTAESGHYYSFIKERPLATDNSSSWVKFNDAEVSRFQPAEIPNQCYGGRRDFNDSSQPYRFDRTFNAYMLFYQRVSSMEEEQVQFPREPNMPARVPLPRELNNDIALENELFMRTYCLTAPYHLNFILDLLRRSRAFKKTQEESTYARSRELAINVALDHLEQIVARSRDQIDSSSFLDELDLAIRESADNALTILRWTRKRPNGIRNLLLKSYVTIRTTFSRLLVACLDKLQSECKELTDSPARSSFLRNSLAQELEYLVIALDNLWPTMHNASKAWDNYFNLLIEIVTFSRRGARLVIERSFLQRCMEVVLAHYEDSRKLKRTYNAYFQKLEKGKQFSFVKLYELFLTLILYIDFTLPVSSGMLTREVVDGKFSLSQEELDLLKYENAAGEPLLIKRVIEQSDNRLVATSFVEILADGVSATQFEDGLQIIFEERLSQPAAFPAPILENILTFCRVSSDEAKITRLIDLAAHSTQKMKGGGREYLAFFQSLLDLANPNIGRSDLITNLVIRRISVWLPPLLCYADAQVRRKALKFGQDYFIMTPEDDTSEDTLVVLRALCRDLCQSCLIRLRDCTAIVANAPTQFDGSQLEQLAQFVKLCLNAYYNEDSEEDAEFIHNARGKGQISSLLTSSLVNISLIKTPYRSTLYRGWFGCGNPRRNNIR